MEHWTAVKNILKYLKRTKDMFLCYGGDQELVVSGYTDASWNTDPDDSKSQSGYVFILNGAAEWASSKHCTAAKSSTESEYIAASEASSEAVWMKRFIVELGQHKDYLDACSEGSFTSKDIEARWDLLDRIEENAEGWENNKDEESGYADKPPFKPLPPKEGNEEKEEEKKKKKKKKKKKGTKKKKKKKENKEKEVTAYPRVNEITLGNRKYVAPNDYYDNESEYNDLPMPFTYISDHDLNEHTTFDIANLWETNSENDDDNNCHSISAIHASSHNDIESSKLGEEVFENPFATDHYVFDTSPSNNNDDSLA
ncbi:hypothetical protein QYE76_056133 [Lolium multiflorum]|uniref:Uncharacterized protein n=1 Tax=Lolium multiflorum TaxID=4521 RepID=A0AAD8WMJ2_LOLMU|nr:hypothetical protein QYE76_056133 [Lolium multiflorum]